MWGTVCFYTPIYQKLLKRTNMHHLKRKVLHEHTLVIHNDVATEISVVTNLGSHTQEQMEHLVQLFGLMRGFLTWMGIVNILSILLLLSMLLNGLILY